jgi:hypothetical protein
MLTELAFGLHPAGGEFGLLAIGWLTILFIPQLAVAALLLFWAIVSAVHRLRVAAQNGSVNPPKKPRRAPYCGAKTPMPVPLRIR